MPFHLAPRSRASRREFLVGLAAGAAAAACRAAAPPVSFRESTWALIADTHIQESEATIARNENMAANLRAVVAEVGARRPGGVLIDGDLALAKGEPGDYRTFLSILEPLRRADLPVHLTLGNHDQRANVADALREGGVPAVEGKRVSALVQDGVQWLFLDSLDVVNATPGSLGARQLAWIAARLDAAPETPALLCVHHNPEVMPNALQDTAALFDALRPRRQAKAVFFGHTHHWRRWEVDGIHCVNLAAVGYVFQPDQPKGWALATIREGGLDLELQSLDPAHPAHGKRETLRWRA